MAVEWREIRCHSISFNHYCQTVGSYVLVVVGGEVTAKISMTYASSGAYRRLAKACRRRTRASGALGVVAAGWCSWRDGRCLWGPQYSFRFLFNGKRGYVMMNITAVKKNERGNIKDNLPKWSKSAANRKNPWKKPIKMAWSIILVIEW